MRRVAFLRTTSRHSAAAGSSDRSSSSSICLRSATSRSSSLGRLRRPPPGRRPTRPSSGSSPRTPRCCGSSRPEPARARGTHARAVRWLRLRSGSPAGGLRGGVRRRLRHREAGRPRLRVHVALRDGQRRPQARRRARSSLGRRPPRPLGARRVARLPDPRLHRALELRRMRKLLAAADAVVMNTPEATGRGRPPVPGARREASRDHHERLRPGRLRRPAARARGRRLPDRPRRQRLPRARPEARRLGRRILGGAAPGLNVVTRSHVHLLEAVEAVRCGSARPRGADRGSPGRVDRRARARHPPCVGGHAWIPGPPRDGRAPALGRPRLPPDARSPARRANADRPREDLRVPRRRTADPGGGPGRRRPRPPRRGRERLPLPPGRRRGDGADHRGAGRASRSARGSGLLGPRCSRATSAAAGRRARPVFDAVLGSTHASMVSRGQIGVN